MPWGPDPGRPPARLRPGPGGEPVPRTTAAPRATGRAPGAPEGPSGGPAPDDGHPWSASVPVNHNGTHQRQRLASTPHPPSGSADRGGRAPSRCGSRSHQRRRPGPAADHAARRRRETPRPSGRPPPRHPGNLVHPIGLSRKEFGGHPRADGPAGVAPVRVAAADHDEPIHLCRNRFDGLHAGRPQDGIGIGAAGILREQEGWRGHQGHGGDHMSPRVVRKGSRSPAITETMSRTSRVSRTSWTR